MPTHYTSFQLKNMAAVPMIIQVNDSDGSEHTAGTVAPGKESLQVAPISATWSIYLAPPENVDSSEQDKQASITSANSRIIAKVETNPLPPQTSTNFDPIDYEAFLKLETGSHTVPIKQLLVSPDGETLISVGESTIRVWDVATRKQVRMLLGQRGVGIDETVENGNIQRIALSHDGKFIVSLSLWKLANSAEETTDVRVYELATGNLQSGFRYPGTLQNLDFSPDDKYLAMMGSPNQPDTSRGVLEIYDTNVLLHGGFGTIPVPVASAAPENHADDTLSTSVRFTPTSQELSVDYQIVVATTQKSENRKSEYTGNLIWYSLSNAGSLKQGFTKNIEEQIVPDTLAVSREFVIVGAYGDRRRYSQDDRKFFWTNHRVGDPVNTVFTESPPATSAFSPDGSRLIVGLTKVSEMDDKRIPANVYDRVHGQFQLKSTYFGHDDRVSAAAFLQDGTAVSSGGDGNAIHFWNPSYVEGEQISVIRGVGRVIHALGINSADQIGFGNHIYRKRGEDHDLVVQTVLQRVFDLHAMTLKAFPQTDPDNFLFSSASWYVLGVGDQIITLGSVGNPEQELPELTLFVGSDDEWVIWSKSGYYNASPHGDRYIGFHVNRGSNKEALYFSSDRFQDVFYKPEVIRAILQYGSEEAVSENRPELGIKIGPVDIEKILPPIIELEEGGVSTFESEDKKQEFVTFTVGFEAHGKEIKRLCVLRNGRLLPIEQRSVPSNGKITVSSIPLVPGKNRFKIFAEIQDEQSHTIKSNPIETTIPGKIRYEDKPILENGTLYILAIGVSTGVNLKKRTDDDETGTFELDYAHTDAEAIYNAFKNNKAFEEVYGNLLVNEQATLRGINNALEDIVQKIYKGIEDGKKAKRDVLLVYLSGHGVCRIIDQQLYFKKHGKFHVPDQQLCFWNYDLDPGNPDKTGLAFLDLGEKITSLPVEVILMTDACHSGIVGSEVVRGLDSNKDGIDPNELAKRIYGINETEMYILNASRRSEYAQEDSEIKHGYFTKAILDALSMSTNLELTMLGLIDQVQRGMQRYTTAQNSVCRMYGDLLRLEIYRK